MPIIRTILLTVFFLTACSSGGGSDNDSGGGEGTQPPATTDEVTVLAANDLGMHCMDRDFSVFSILPPFNVVNVQVVKRDINGRPVSCR